MARFTTTGGSGEGTPGPQGAPGQDGADGNDGAPGADGADGQYPNYLGEYNNGASYPIGAIVSIPVGSPYGNPGQLFIRATNAGNPGYPPGTESWTEYTNGLVVAGLPAYLPLKAFQEASNYSVDYGYFSHATYGNSIAIARTPQVDAYMNYAVTAGVPQSWTFKSFGEHASFTLTLGVPLPNVENTAPNKEIWTLEYDSTAYSAISSGLTNGNEYGIYLTDTGAIGIDGTDGTTGPAAEETSFTVNGGTLGTQPTFDGAPLFSGSYVKNGPLVHFQIQVDMDNITNFGTGQYYVELPFPAKHSYHFRDACLHDSSGTVRQYALSGHVYAGQSQVALWFTSTSGQDELFDYNSPALLTVNDNFHISGTYISE
jgi:hypothetical protein